jgi:restriction system protein
LLCQKYFECRGIRADKTGAGADGGVDIVLYKAQEALPFALVQCKTKAKKVVGVNAVRELYGVMASMKVNRGMLMANNYFSEDAIDFAKNKNLKLVSGNDFWNLISDLPTDRQQSLERFLSGIDYITHTCPNCEIKVLKRNGKNGSEFWGCPNYSRKPNPCMYKFYGGKN